MTYEQTTRYHWPLLTERNTTGYTKGLPEIVYGQLGFDDAVQLDKEQVRLLLLSLWLLNYSTFQSLVSGSRKHQYPIDILYMYSKVSI